MNDGLDLDLFEVVFVKAREFQHVHSLARYTEYFTGKDDLTSNEFNSPRMQLAFEEECTALKRRVEQCHVGVVDEKTRCSTLTPTVLRKDGPIASSLQNMGLGVIKSLPRKTSAYLCTIFLPIQSTRAKTAHSRERKSANYRKAESLGVWTCLTRLFLIHFFLSLLVFMGHYEKKNYREGIM